MELTPEQIAAAEAEAQTKAAEAKAKAEQDKAAADAEFLKGLNLPAEKIETLKNDPDLFAAFKHQIEAKRQANAEAKTTRLELDKIKKDQDAADAKAKADAGKFQELYEAEKKKNDDAAVKLKVVLIQGELKRVAAEKGIKKLDYLKLFDQSKLELTDDMQVTGLDDFDKFVTDNPELFGGTTPPPPGKTKTDTNKPSITKTSADLLAELATLKATAQRTQTPTDLAAYNRKMKECREKKLVQ